jgi:glycosyltransferase involved in cell wall biosynthesis
MGIKIAIMAHACRGGGGLFQTTNLLNAFKNVVQDEQFLVIYSAGYGYEQINLPSNSEVFIYPQMNVTSRLRNVMLKYQLRKSLQGTNLFFCQTPIIKRKFSQKYNYPENQIQVLGFPPPVEVMPSDDLPMPNVINKNSGVFYILVLTSYMPHKNPSVVLSVCNRYGSQIRDKKIKFITTVEPNDHPRAPAFLKAIKKNNLGDVVANVGALCRRSVASYLYHSDVFWLPTLLECFSTSHLEALAVGIPIMAPDLDFARYICDDAAVYYNPWDIDSVFEKIMLLRQNQRLREELVKKARLQLQNNDKFPRSWNEVAAITLQELRKLAQIK